VISGCYPRRPPMVALLLFSTPRTASRPSRPDARPPRAAQARHDSIQAARPRDRRIEPLITRRLCERMRREVV
jgi:hypothetical protein